jgi:hypothetical protein
MKGKIYTVIFLLSSYISFSQTPEDALRLSWFQLKGTARNQAIGGAMASLGGDATANHINPAGWHFLKHQMFLLHRSSVWKKQKYVQRNKQYRKVKLSLTLEHLALYSAVLDTKQKTLLVLLLHNKPILIIQLIIRVK